MKHEHSLVVSIIGILVFLILLSTVTSWTYSGGGYHGYQMMQMMGGGMMLSAGVLWFLAVIFLVLGIFWFIQQLQPGKRR